MSRQYTKVKECRICGSLDLKKYLDLGRTPLANSFLNPKDANKEEDMFPLEVLLCKNCMLSQLSIVVDPKILFSSYVYHSSVSKTFQEHCRQMAQSAIEFGIPESCLAVDIASNDGCLLEQFKIMGFKTVGIEPAKNIAKLANSKGIETICSFWNIFSAKEILRMHGHAFVITATNVFAHVDNLNDFLQNVSLLLDDKGLFIVEVPHMLDLFEKNEFDTVYHEHLSYFLVKPLKLLYEKNNLKIVKIEKYPIHGGSLRIYAQRKEKEDSSVQRFIDLENDKGLYNIAVYWDIEKKVKSIKSDLVNLLNGLKEKGKKIAAYGASAKGNTLLNYCKLGKTQIDFIVDDTPQKQGLFAPGSKIPIKDASILEKEKPDYILLLAWNFAKEIISKTEKSGFSAKYIIPVPKVEILQ